MSDRPDSRFAGHTPGPWRWVVNLHSRDVHISGGKPRYDLTVVDFVRWGTQQAAPRFRENHDGMNIMHRCDAHASIVPGREHHEDWFRDIDHPDARLIAAAPDLLAENAALRRERDALREALRKIAAEPEGYGTESPIIRVAYRMRMRGIAEAALAEDSAGEM